MKAGVASRALLTVLAAFALAGPAAGCAHPATAAARPAPRAGVLAASAADAVAADLLTMPRFARTAKDRATDPINVVLAADEAPVAAAFHRAGWLPADPLTFKAVLKLVKAAVTGGEYPTSPISTLYLYGERQAFAFQKNPKGIAARDHLRVWRTPLRSADGRPYWAVSATRDASLGLSGVRPIHHIDPDVDAERRLVVDDLAGLGGVAWRTTYRAFEPGFRGRNGEGDPYVTDGLVEVLALASSGEARPDPSP